MIKLENVVLASPDQMEFIIEGMRNPMNSWDKSDTETDPDLYSLENMTIGNNDHSLMQRLAKAGTDHRKFMRMMPVYVRITAPLYWWKEFDTYKVGTVAHSCSTMHKIAEKEFELEDFSTDKIIDAGEPEYEDMYDDIVLNLHFDFDNQYYDPHDIFGEILLPALNLYREKYIKTKDKKYWWQMIQLLPSSYNQTRNVMLNYEVLANMYHSRKNHRLDEWQEFCKWIETLPYSELITGEEKTDD